jgi:hypothetical protein
MTTQLRFSWLFGALLGALILLLSACGAAGITAADVPIGNGAVSPKNAVDGYFQTLNRTLKDPNIKNDDVRQKWVNQLAAFFAPNERDDQRVMIGTSLDQFTQGLKTELKPNESVTLEVRYDALEPEMTDGGSRAVVRAVNGAIHLMIVGDTTWEQPPVPLSQLTGRADNTIPVVRIGDHWFLTEG